MAFLIYKKETKQDKQFYIHGYENYRLAGWGLIYSLWTKKGKPKNRGWSITSDDLLKEFNETYSSQTHSLVIDFHPSSTERIGLIEIENIHLFTYGNDDAVFWTPMMLELRDVYYDEDFENLTQEEKQKIISEIEPLPNRQATFFEFLYLNGDDKSWNWGKNGMTNAAFIFNDARQYFAKYFAAGL
ncbi:MAG: hypothetical protein IPO49_00325 [Bacteroidetes bacterium]|nr:hypothetical protein [Bacteroidota bacterium]